MEIILIIAVYILIIAVYILGCVLAYGRVRASLFDASFSSDIEDMTSFAIITSLSWISFIGGSLLYYVNDEQTFFKFK